MIKANELRIGNFYVHNGEILEVNPSTFEDIWHGGESWADPIHLTEEWLLNFGFKKITPKKYGFLSDAYAYTKGISLVVYFDGHRLSVKFWQGNEKKYVHELQNFFFSLTGAELTVA